MDSLYRRTYGIPRSTMNAEFLSGMDRTLRILEVGSNAGVQLRLLERMGFKNLHGIELQEYALEIARRESEGINFQLGNALELPYDDGFFDLVFTSGVLIHISPQDHERVMGEMFRCTSRWIWGFEYFAEQLTPVVYRDREELLWKADFAAIFRTHYSGSRAVKERRFIYQDQPKLVDKMYLLEKTG